jgi:hypothetical protein
LSFAAATIKFLVFVIAGVLQLDTIASLVAVAARELAAALRAVLDAAATDVERSDGHTAISTTLGSAMWLAGTHRTPTAMEIAWRAPADVAWR